MPPSGHQLNDPFTVMLRSFLYMWRSKQGELYVAFAIYVSHILIMLFHGAPRDALYGNEH